MAPASGPHCEAAGGNTGQQHYRAPILHYCNDHVLLVLNEFHSHKKTECWILKFNSKATWECPQVPG